MTSLTKNRIDSLDLLKGIIMVLMALDHTKDFFYKAPNLFDMTNPDNVTMGAYFTRWITHFCAPGFSFLAGVSAYLIGIKKTKNQLTSFLIKRGIWLVFIQWTIIQFAWYFDIHFKNIDFSTISSLGFSMIALALIIHLPKNIILILSLLIIFCHNLLDNVHFNNNIFWSVFHEYSFYKLSDNFNINIIYPIIPWIGVMSLGYYFGNYYSKSFDTLKRKGLLNRIGVLAILSFFLLRFSNFYGDLTNWKYYETTTKTFFSFLNVNKYPPSLLFLLITLGGTFVFLANSEKLKGRMVDFFCVFGRVPFFYYIIHLYLIHIVAMILAQISGYGWQIMIQETFEMNLKGFGFSLPIVCCIWVAIILTLYPICKMFDSYKQGNKDKWWLSYL